MLPADPIVPHPSAWSRAGCRPARPGPPRTHQAEGRRSWPLRVAHEGPVVLGVEGEGAALVAGAPGRGVRLLEEPDHRRSRRPGRGRTERPAQSRSTSTTVGDPDLRRLAGRQRCGSETPWWAGRAGSVCVVPEPSSSTRTRSRRGGWPGAVGGGSAGSGVAGTVVGGSDSSLTAATSTTSPSSLVEPVAGHEIGVAEPSSAAQQHQHPLGAGEDDLQRLRLRRRGIGIGSGIGSARGAGRRGSSSVGSAQISVPSLRASHRGGLAPVTPGEGDPPAPARRSPSRRSGRRCRCQRR